MGEHLLSRAPFVRITILYILGIVLALFLPYNSNIIYFSIAALFVFALIILKFLTRRIYYINILYGIILSAIIILMAYSYTSYKTNVITSKKDVKGTLITQVSSSNTFKNNFYKLELNVLFKKESGNYLSINTNVVAFLKADTDTINIQIGDIVLLNTEFKDVTPPKNPYQFNYKEYLKYSGISKVGFANKENWKLIENHEFNIFRTSENVRQFFIAKLKQFDIKPENLAIITAIVLGDKSDISDDLGTEFANAGAMHILAVSGLHVGILFLMLTVLFNTFAGYKIGKYLKFVLIILILWAYAFITGLSPSVVRSVIMFSLVSISIIIQRQHNIYNTVFVSAFILLVFDPFYLLKIGFQLSYLAVIGIVFFQPRISKIVKSKNKILRYFLDLVAVSIAAQIATAPLTLYYFNKFPNYFIITNLSVMMLVTMILSVGIAFLALSFIPYVNNFFAKILDLLLDAMTYIIHKINSLPYSITDLININLIEMFLIYSILIFFAFYLINRTKKYVNLLLVSVFIFVVYFNFNFYLNYNKSELIFFSVKQRAFIGLIDQNKSLLICNENYEKSKKDIDFNIKKYLVRKHTNEIKLHFLDNIKNIEEQNIYCDSNFVKIKSKTIFFLRNNYNSPNTNIKIDYLYLINFNKYKFEEIIKRINPEKVIISNKIPQYYENDVIEICERNKVEYYSMLNNDALIVKI